MSNKVWITKVYVGCDVPKVEQYELDSTSKSGWVKVRIRGTTKMFRPAAGRKFFFTEEKMRLYFRLYLIS